MRNNRLVNLAAFAIFLLVGQTLLAQTSSSAVKPKATETQTIHLTWRQIMDKLQLTSDQKQAVLKNRHSYRKDMVVLEGKIKVKQVELENELEKPERDETKLDLICQEIGVLYGQELSRKVKAKLELEKILTPQQLDALKSLEGPSSEENIY
jgi:Spy/CpxP family protein refolding chaperone